MLASSMYKTWTRFASNLHRHAHSRPTHLSRSGYSKRFQSSTGTTTDAIGVTAALTAKEGEHAKATIFSHEFALHDRVALVTGGQGGIGLEASLALVEAGARAVYCIDLPKEPSDNWFKVQKYAERMEKSGEGRLEYISADVTDQEKMWKIGENIGDREGRMDICVAAAGITGPPTDVMDCPAELHKKVLDVNSSGALYTAQSAGRQMTRFGQSGSIILVASLGGTLTLRLEREAAFLPYGASKASVLQMARTMACSLAPKGIRVNSLSPGWFGTGMTNQMIDVCPSFFQREIPMERVGQPHELRGAIVWLASDASTYCTGSDILIAGGFQAW